MGEDTERVTVRLKDDLMADVAAVVESEDVTQSQLVRAGLRREIAHRTGEDVEDVLTRLENATEKAERQATRLERLPLE